MRKIISLTVLAFIIFEISLYLTEQYLFFIRRKGGNDKDVISIVCVGDSHTFGVGTSSQYSYPSQLETLLNNNNLQRFKVFNLGIPGANTAKQIEILKHFLNNKYASIAIVLTGRNNSDNETQNWKNISKHIKNRSFYLRSIRIAKQIVDYFLHNQKRNMNIDAFPSVNDKNYINYMTFYLKEVKDVCQKHNAKIILLSYYNSANNLIKDFAAQNGIAYFDFTQDFKILFTANEKFQYISPDKSHMNFRGYKFFAEKLYEYLFLNQKYAGIKINHLRKKIEDKYFYGNKEDIIKNIERQKIRIEEYKNSWEYPFELIHLGHIYAEVKERELAKEFYTKGLIASNYQDNNTIITPLISWYLNNNAPEEALNVCKEILRHNPKNQIARSYYDWIISNYFPG